MANATSHALLRRLLSPAEARVTIPAAPEDVFAVLRDPKTYPEWLAGAQHVRRVDGEFPKPGAAFEHEVGPTEAVTVMDQSESLINDPPNRLQLAVHAGPVDGIVDFQLARTSAGTEVTLRESAVGRLGFAMPLLRMPLHVRNKASLERLKQRFMPLIIPL
jgi:uncharacterized protein YndB with AHSA1/START domain